MDREEEIDVMANAIPSKIVSYNGDPKGQHLYLEQRLQIAEALCSVGYRKQSEGEWIAHSLTSTSKRGRKINNFCLFIELSDKLC